METWLRNAVGCVRLDIKVRREKKSKRESDKRESDKRKSERLGEAE